MSLEQWRDVHGWTNDEAVSVLRANPVPHAGRDAATAQGAGEDHEIGFTHTADGRERAVVQGRDD